MANGPLTTPSVLASFEAQQVGPIGPVVEVYGANWSGVTHRKGAAQDSVRSG